MVRLLYLGGNHCGFSLLSQVQLLEDIFESIVSVQIVSTKEDSKIIIGINNKYSNYEDTEKEIKKIINKDENEKIVFILF